MNKIIGIYKIVNRVNNKIYIGQSVDINYRLYIHKRNAKKNKRHPLYASMRKYGIENFEFIIIEQMQDVCKLDVREQYWISYYKSNDKNYGYNLRLECTTNRGCKYSEETRKRFSERQKRLWQNPEYVKNLSEKNKDKISPNKGKKMSAKSNKQNSNRIKELWQDPVYRAKMMESRKNSEEKRIATINNKKEFNPSYQQNILEKIKQTRIKNGTTKIYSIDKNKVISLYINQNYELREVARIMNLSFGLLGKFLKLNNIKKRKTKNKKIRQSITDEQLHKICDSAIISL